jgi:hypothetical protein
MAYNTFGLAPTTNRQATGNIPNSSPNSSNGGGDIIVGRVISIILDESNPEEFKQNGEWDSIGLVFYEDIKGGGNGKAKPLFPNIKLYPLVNELIYIINLPNPEVQLINLSLEEGSIITNQSYYFPPINVWNGVHHNAVPLISDNRNEIISDYTSSQAGLSRQVQDGSTSINLNPTQSKQTFQERIDVQPLLPYAGDHILEGRWGQSIRFGSTVTGSFIKNDWSAPGIGTEGDPITLIRNGAWDNGKDSWVNTLENINQDSSSVYLTSTQQIPLSASSINDYYSYKSITAPTQPNLYSGSQIIINSGRLIFNSREDHILLSSKKTINLNSQEGLFFDTIGDTVFQSDNIYLGTDATEPLLKGNVTEALLNQMINYIKSLNNALKTVTVETPSGPGTIASLQAFANVNSIAVNSLSTNNITSSRNFTI